MKVLISRSLCSLLRSRLTEQSDKYFNYVTLIAVSDKHRRTVGGTVWLTRQQH
jgi:hypothetical protein